MGSDLMLKIISFWWDFKKFKTSSSVGLKPLSFSVISESNSIKIGDGSVIIF